MFHALDRRRKFKMNIEVMIENLVKRIGQFETPGQIKIDILTDGTIKDKHPNEVALEDIHKHIGGESGFLTDAKGQKFPVDVSHLKHSDPKTTRVKFSAKLTPTPSTKINSSKQLREFLQKAGLPEEAINNQVESLKQKSIDKGIQWE